MTTTEPTTNESAPVYHEDDVKLAKELAEAHEKLIEVSERFYKATGWTYRDIQKNENVFLAVLARARKRRNALAKLTEEDRKVLYWNCP